MTLAQARAPLSIGEVKHHVYVKRQINVNLFQVTKFPLSLVVYGSIHYFYT